MFPGMNPKDLEKAMKRLGIKQEEIDASEVIIKTQDKELIFKSPQVSKINMMGQDTYQIIGTPNEREISKFTKDDVKMVMEQTNCSEKEAIKALENSNGDIAEAILSLKD